MSLKSQELRKRFLDYFVSKQHTVVTSSPLIPAQDPTLLFANAGMNQFKEVFLGKEKRSYTRAVSIQKCMRAGGKHNDLDQVGFTARHLTFFEMMGNFSFGDYFKKEAIIYAWEFLTKIIGLPADLLYVSVYTKDDEAYDLWHSMVGIPPSRIIRLGAADNFWQMGDTGPCGPCTEIYVDRGADKGCGDVRCAPGCACDRFLEIWNNVFMQFDRQSSGEDIPLLHKGVDTGMGLERLCMVVQGVFSVYQTDLFMPLIAAIERETGIVYAQAAASVQASFHVIADHVRSVSGAIADGGMPSNEGRGYVIRKIIRRATLFAQKLGCIDLLGRLIPIHIEHFKNVYPELAVQRELIMTVVSAEIEKFATHLVQGRALVIEYIHAAHDRRLSGGQVFKLYDTYGFPIEVTELIAHEYGYTIDREGFDHELERQRIQSGKKQEGAEGPIRHISAKTQFTGYDHITETSKVLGIIVDGRECEAVTAGTTCWIVPERTPFYVECGGQISDIGTLVVGGIRVPLEELTKVDGAILCRITTQAPLARGDVIEQYVDEQKRRATMKNHTATHLLQAALIQVLGAEVKQSGSLVAPDYLRFDFTCSQQLTPAHIAEVERLINDVITRNIPLHIAQSTYQEAVQRGVIAFFGEKYNPDAVRVVTVPGISAELCGGTHVKATGDIGICKITESHSLSAGTRRLVAVTGSGALALFQEIFQTTQELGKLFKVQRAQILNAVARVSDQLRDAQQQLKKTRKQLFQYRIREYVETAPQYNGMPYQIVELEEIAVDELKDLLQYMQGVAAGCYCIMTKSADKVLYACAVAPRYSLDCRTLATKLKTCGYQGGASQHSFQGGASASAFDARVFKECIEQWIKG